MNRLRLHALGFFPVFLVLTASLPAQAPVETIPVLARLPEMARYEVNVRPGADAQQDPMEAWLETLNPRVSRIEVTKSGAVRRETRHYATPGVKPTDLWILEGRVFVYSPGNRFPEIRDADEKISGMDFKNDFPELAWVGPANFVRLEIFEGRNCALFQQSAHSARLDAKTGLPIWFSDGRFEHRYSFSLTPPTEILQPPQEIVRLAEKMARGAAGRRK